MFARRTVSSHSIRQTTVKPEMAQSDRSPKSPTTTTSTTTPTARTTAKTTGAPPFHSLPIPIPGSRAEKRRTHLKKFHPGLLPGPKHYYSPLPTSDPDDERRGKVAARGYVSSSEVSELAPPLLCLEVVGREPMGEAERAKEGSLLGCSLRCAVPVVYGNGHWISMAGVDWVRAAGQLSNGGKVPSQGPRGKSLTPAQSSVRANLEAHDAVIAAKKAAERRSYDEKEGLSPAARKAAVDGLAEAMEWYERRCKRIARKVAKEQLAEAIEWCDWRVEQFERVLRDSAVAVAVGEEESVLVATGLEEVAYLGPRPARMRELSSGLFWVGGGRCACTVDELVSGAGCGKGGCEV